MKLIPVAKLHKDIVAEHKAAMQHACEAIKHVIKCGRLLAVLKAQSEGAWEENLPEGISRTTAWRYIRCAQDAAKNAAKVKHLLDQGASLVDLYREFGLVKAVEGGGYRSDAYKRRKALGQLELDFEFEEFKSHVTALIKAPNVETLGETTLSQLEKDLEAALKRVREVQAGQKFIELEESK